MAKNKDFEMFASKVFGEFPGKAKHKEQETEFDADEPTIDEFHPMPIDVVVVDKNKNVVAKGERGNLATQSGTSSYHERPMTPIDINLQSTVLPDFGDIQDHKSSRPEYLRTKQLKQEKKHGLWQDHKRRSKQTDYESDLDRSICSSDDSISLDSPSSSTTSRKTQDMIMFSRQDSGNKENEQGFFCIDHMKMCTSKSSKEKHKNCHIDVPSGRSNSRNSGKTMTSMTEMYVKMLENLYGYSGIMVEDRHQLKQHLIQQKDDLETSILDQMEDIVTKVLQLKNEFLQRLDEFHDANISHVTQQTTKLYKLRYEARQVWEELQVPDDYDDFAGFQDTIHLAANRAMTLKDVLHHCYNNNKVYNYQLRPTEQTRAILNQDQIAYPYAQEMPSSLPPFLRCSDDFDDDTSSSSDVSGRSETIAEVDYITLACDEGDTVMSNCYFTGCTYITPEYILLTDWSNNVLRLTNLHGILCDSLPLERGPWDLTSACDGQAFVTVPKLRQVIIVESDPNLHIVSSFKTHGECFGICKVRGGYVVTCDACSRSPSVQMYSADGEVKWVIDVDVFGQRWFSCPLHVCTDYLKTTVYVSDSGNNSIHVVSLGGDIRTTYKHNALNYPAGLVTDRHNFLYVCSKRGSALLRFDKKGRKEKNMLKNPDVRNPGAVCIHPDGDHFILTDLSGQRSAGYWKLNSG